MSKPVVGVAGMGHLGQVMAYAIERKGFEVVRYSKSGVPPVIKGEFGLPWRNPIYDRAEVRRCNLVYIAEEVETPSDYAKVTEMIETLRPVLSREICMVVISQVAPGFTGFFDWPPECRYYQLDTLITGHAVMRALKPERLIVGCHDPSKPLHPYYACLLNAFDCPILSMRYESAELAKIAINFVLASQIAAANTVLAATKRTRGANWFDVETVLRSDARIGARAYVSPGFIGGHLPRDIDRIGKLVEADFLKGIRAYVQRN